MRVFQSIHIFEDISDSELLSALLIYAQVVPLLPDGNIMAIIRLPASVLTSRSLVKQYLKIEICIK